MPAFAAEIEATEALQIVALHNEMLELLGWIDQASCARGLPAGDAPGAGVFRRSAPTLRLSTTSAAADAKTTYCSTSRSKPASAA